MIVKDLEGAESGPGQGAGELSGKGSRGYNFRMEKGLGPLMERLARVAGLLWQKGWAEASAGNISINLRGLVSFESSSSEKIPLSTPRPELSGTSFLFTAAGSRMRDLAENPERGTGVITLSDDGAGYRVSWSGADGFRPSSELPSHLAIHGLLSSRGSDCRVVLHAHPSELIALSLRKDCQDPERLNRLLFSAHPEVGALIPEGVGLVPYLLPGSEELSAETLKAFQNRRIVIWANHGAVAAGRDTDEAFDLMDILNKAARIILLSGGGVGGLTEKH